MEDSVKLSSFEDELEQKHNQDLQQQQNEEELHRKNIVSFNNNRENELISQMISNEMEMEKEREKQFVHDDIEISKSIIS